MAPAAGSSDLLSYLTGAGLAAVVNFPLWKAAAIGQSGFKTSGSTAWQQLKVLCGPPYKGVAATMFGMTWARAAIFYCADTGKQKLLAMGAGNQVATSVPAVGISTLVQVVNQPIVRGTITVQDPGTKHPNLTSALSHIYRTRGAAGLWHGTGASVLKTVPKYVTAIWVKDLFQDLLPKPTARPGEPGHRSQVLRLSAVKSVAAGVAGAALTNPLDVIRNEMFKTDEGMVTTTRRLMRREGLAFLWRGMGRNLVAVAAPIGMTIFLTDAISDWRLSARELELKQQGLRAGDSGAGQRGGAPLQTQRDARAHVAGDVIHRVASGTVPPALALRHMIATSTPAEGATPGPPTSQREV